MDTFRIQYQFLSKKVWVINVPFLGKFSPHVYRAPSLVCVATLVVTIIHCSVEALPILIFLVKVWPSLANFEKIPNATVVGFPAKVAPSSSL